MQICQQCQKVLKSGQEKFCSKNCKSESQKKRIILKCSGCNKEISILPCLKRKANYCSRACYWNTNNKKFLKKCSICKKSFLVKKYLVDQGYGIYCSRKCLNKTYPKKIIKKCLQCGLILKIQPSKSPLVKFCSKECHDDYMRDYVEKICRNCHQKFKLPRWELNKGKGSFCCRDCFIQYKGETTIEKKVRQALEKSNLKFKQEFKIGIYRADFLIQGKKMIIECDGDYWHKIPGAIDRDLRKDKYLTNLSYKIIRITESRIRKLSLSQLTKEISGRIN
ncbi:MAG: DUF559 domain-containing protein [Patescibacteria group bacterium]